MITHGFTRPSGKKVSGEELVKICTEYIAKDPMAEYEITVGTDSQDHKFVTLVRVVSSSIVWNMCLSSAH